jgi:hypothetical protein
MSTNPKRIKIRATITIDLSATDYVDAARLQGEMEALCVKLGLEYGPSELDMRERRAPRS